MDNHQVVPPQPSKAKKLIIATALALGVVTVVAIVIAVVVSSKDYSHEVSVLAAQQAETVRIAGIGVEHDRSTQTIRNYATTVQSTVTSANQRLRSVSGGIPSQEIQAQYRDESIDSTLENAASINQFNERFIAILSSHLNGLLNQATVASARITDDNDLSTVNAIIEETQVLIDELP